VSATGIRQRSALAVAAIMLVAQLVVVGAATPAVVAAQAPFVQDFEGVGSGSDPVGWLDTGVNNGLSEDDSLFSVMSAGGSQVLGTDSSGSNIHSHYVAESVSAADGFTFAGRMMMSSGVSGVGVTFLSDYPASDTYYRLRRYNGAGGSFRLSPHGTSVTGEVNSGVVPSANTWYEFEIAVSDTGSATEIRAKVWESGAAKPQDWQIDAVDSSGSRLTSGPVGVWSHAGGSKYWDDLTVDGVAAPGPWGVAVSTTGSGSVAVSPDLSGSPDGYPDGTEIAVTATPDVGWRFVGWSGDVSGSVSPVTVVVDRDLVVEALFVEDVPVTVTTDVVGDGVVTVDPDQSSFEVGAVATLTATPGAGQRFVGWSGDVSGVQNPVSVTLSADITATATFEPTAPVTVTLLQSGQGTVGIEPDATQFDAGDSAQLTAAAGSGWRFDRWVADPPIAPNWWDDRWGYRVGVAVDAAGTARVDALVDVPIDFTQAFADLGVQRALDDASVRVVEVDAQGVVVDPDVAFQFVRGEGFDATAAADGTLWLEMAGSTPADATRHFDVYFDVVGTDLPAPTIPARVAMTDGVAHNGLDTVRVTNDLGTYYYDVDGGGFASVIDTDGNDWVSWSSASGAQGEYRGIPNLVYPGGLMHPGNGGSSTSIVADGPLLTVLRSESNDGQWTTVWSIGPTWARLEVVEAAGDYWFLYEGTPGGLLEPQTDLVTRSDGTVTPASTSWTADLAGDEWVAFGDPGLGRSLYVVNHQDDAIVDSYRPMNGAMTVFGFGRDGNAANLDHVPGQYTFSLVDALGHAPVAQRVGSDTEPVQAVVAAAESQLGSDGAASASVVFTEDVTITAVFEESLAGSLITDVVGAGSITVDPSLTEYQLGQQVELTAVPAPGSSFTGWSGDVSGSANPTTVVVGVDTKVTATFVAQQTAPTIDVWNGTDQHFGDLGVPQVAVNVHGNVSDPDGIASLSYTLNGGPSAPLRLGGDMRRLARPGDFNVELPVVDLIDGDNDLRITAVDGTGEVATADVNVAFSAGNVWPTTYDVDWSTVTDIQDVAQVVDGKWSLESGGLRILEPSYDRLVAIGDISWTDYEVTVPVTINDIDEAGFVSGPSGTAAAVGLLMRWSGHTDDPIVTQQPKTGWQPFGAIGWWWWDTPTSARQQIMGNYGSTLSATSYGTPPTVGSTLMYKMRVETEAGGYVRYRLKIWDATTTEPSSWTLEGMDTPSDPQNGSLLLLAHHVDATFGDVSVRPVNGSSGLDLAVGTVGSGSVDVTPDQPDYAFGDDVVLTATPDQDWTFTGWTGDITSTDNPLAITMTESLDLTANFASLSDDPIISDVDVQAFTTGARVSWTTDKPTTGVVAYGETASHEIGTAASSVWGTQHSVVLDGLTPATQYHYRIDVVDGSSNAAGTADATFVTVDQTALSGFVSDDFNDCSVDPVWNFVDPVGDGTVTLDGTRVEISVPGGVAHDVWTGGNMAPRLMQPVANTDFTYVAKFDSTVLARYQMQGFIIEQDAQNFLRFDVYGSGSGQFLYAAQFVGGAATARANVPVAIGGPVWLSVTRSADEWTYAYSVDGESFTTVASFGLALDVASAGVFAGNTGSGAPAHTAVVDYVFDALDPILDEDADTPACSESFAVTVDTIGEGTVSLSPDQPSYQSGDVVTVTATAGTDAVFTGWQGDVTSSENPLAITVDGPIDLTAVFDEVTTEPTSGFVSDDFNACAVDGARWAFIDPIGDGTVRQNGTQLELSVPAGVAHDVWTGGNMAPRLMQTVNDVDMQLVAKFDSAVSASYQLQGFIIEQDPQNYLRLEVHGSGGSTRLLAARITAGSPTILANYRISAAAPIWLRVTRSGDQWSFDYSADGVGWVIGPSFVRGLQISSAGVFVGNAGVAPAHTALVDYVFDTAAPIVDEDADVMSCP